MLSLLSSLPGLSGSVEECLQRRCSSFGAPGMPPVAANGWEKGRLIGVWGDGVDGPVGSKACMVGAEVCPISIRRAFLPLLGVDGSCMVFQDGDLTAMWMVEDTRWRKESVDPPFLYLSMPWTEFVVGPADLCYPLSVFGSFCSERVIGILPLQRKTSARPGFQWLDCTDGDCRGPDLEGMRLL